MDLGGLQLELFCRLTRSGRCAKVVAVACALFVLGGGAQAGHYDVSYFSGVVNVRGPNGVTWQIPFTLGESGYYGGGSLSANPPGPGGEPGQVGPGQVDCVGPVVVLFAWNNGGNPFDRPPSAAVLSETAYATWVGETGSCANGLGHPETGGPNDGLSQGSRWTVVQNPGEYFTITKYPHASGVLSQPVGLLMNASAHVGYRAQLTPIRVLLRGTALFDGGHNVMIGHKVTSLVDAGGYEITGYTWLVSGDKFKFAEWGPESEPGKGDYQYHRYHLHVGADIYQSTFSWYWYQGVDSETGSYIDQQVRCLVELELPDGATPTVSVEEWVRVWLPQFHVAAQTRGTTTYDPNTLEPKFVLSGRQITSLGQLYPGFEASSWVAIPAAFGYAEWLYGQLCKINRTKYCSTWPFTRTVTTNGYVLDRRWPYEAGPWPANFIGESPFWHYIEDSPFTSLPNFCYEFAVDDEFWCFQAFRPGQISADGDEEWVALRRVVWAWLCNGDKAPNGWWLGPFGGTLIVFEDDFNTWLMQWEEVFYSDD